MIQTKSVLKDYFETGDKPTQQQYENLIDSLRHAYDKIPLDDLEEDVVSQSEFQSHLDNATFNGDVTAVNFIGDGSQLTGITFDNLPNDLAYSNINNNFTSSQHINGDLSLGTATNSNLSLIRSGYNYITASDATGALVFRTGGSNVRLRIESTGTAAFFGDLNMYSNDLNFLGGSTDWKMYTSGDHVYIRETAIGDRVAFYSGGLTKFNLNSSVAEFNSDADASIKLSSNDPYTGIAFQDPLGFGYMFYHGTKGYTLDNNLEITDNTPRFVVTDTDQNNVGIGDTQSAILLKGMYASGSVDSSFSQARLRLIKDQVDGTAGSAFAIDVMNNAGGISTLTERFVIDSNGDFDFKNGAGTFGGLITGNAGMTLGSTASTTTRNPQYLVFGGSAGSEYGMELGYDSVREKYSTRIITSSSQDIAFGAMNAPATDHSDFTEYMVIKNGGDFDFKSGAATFGGNVEIAGALDITKDDNSLAGITITNTNVNSGAAATLRLISDGGSGYIYKTSNAFGLSGFADTLGIQNAEGILFITGSTMPRYEINSSGHHDFKSGNATFGGTITVSSDNNILADFTSTDSIGEIRIGDNIAYTRLLTSGSDFKIMPNNGTEVAVLEGDTLKTILKGSLDVTTTSTFGGNVVINDHLNLGDSDQLRMGASNDLRAYHNGTDSFMDNYTGRLFIRQRLNGGDMHLQVEDDSATGQNLVTLKGTEGVVELAYQNTKKLETTPDGITISGELSVVKSGSASPHADTDLFVADSTAAGSSSQVQILGGNTGNSNLFFSDTDSYSSGGIKYRHPSDEMIFRVGNVDLVSIEDKGVTIGSGSVSGQPRLNYQKDANNSNGWYAGYLNSSPSNNDFGIYSFESADFKVYTNDTLALTLDNTQSASFSGEITASGAIMSNAGFSTGVQSANSGAIRLENEDKITSRNNANSGNRTLLYLDSLDVLQIAEATDANFGGKITATNFVGDGSLLTNLPSQNPTGYAVTGTPAGADLELTLGVPSGAGNSTRILIDDDSNSINLAADETTIGGSTLVITGDIDGSAAIFSGDVDADNLISQNDITANGTLKIGQIDLGGLNTIPASSSSTGTTGQIRIDANHIYVCVATNTWKRVALATW
jgi:hypothetical protein